MRYYIVKVQAEIPVIAENDSQAQDIAQAALRDDLNACGVDYMVDSRYLKVPKGWSPQDVPFGAHEDSPMEQWFIRLSRGL